DFSDRYVAAIRAVVRCGDQSSLEAADATVAGVLTVDQLSQTDIGGRVGRIANTGARYATRLERARASRRNRRIDAGHGEGVVVDVDGRHENARAGRNVIEGGLQTGSE